ncbi:DNA replication regulator SLD2 [Colletotrichum sublineola]|uniref:DNA replication regulator SLD2 n=1 Tax=Colletotrichum sublineola TaxID=1173701 RepID=A0A066XVA1_COLSU|nr:DNA replication regulator SLD2 [Colletotrichum sublineola]KDN71629.1 putative DNA replication regulator SLD2 [Colletotrichum sublineola]
MDDKTRADYETQAQKLRAELKSWETSWAKSHEGRKPSRDDIKRNTDIAQKYKQYNKVRDVLSGKILPFPNEDPRLKKRKEDPVPTTTPSKKRKHAETPSKIRSNPDDAGLASTPSISRTLFSPVAPRSIGPTPQRDGRVLGLFDLMVERELGTPSRKNRDLNTTADTRSMTTPRKRATPTDDEGNARFGRTPMSASKRQMLDSFMTPLKNKDSEPFDAKTPTTVSKLQFNTPSFLKRHTQPPPTKDDDFVAPPLRLPRKPIVRGLSAIVASLRKVEEENLDNDDDLDALREAEGEVSRSKAPPKPSDDMLAADSQVHLPLGGFDDEGLYDSPDEEQTGQDGMPLRVYKKKGQKRTTRRVNMKPVHIKRPSDPAEDGQEEEADEETVPETQANGAADDMQDELAGVGSGSDDEFDESASRAKTTKKTAKKTEKMGTVKKAVRKVNEMAHTNFRRLKLKNNGAKGGPGYNSKFRRRR